MCSMKCTGTDSGAGTGSGAVPTVHCAVCSGQCPACNRKKVNTLNQISLTNFFYYFFLFFYDGLRLYVFESLQSKTKNFRLI